MKIIKILLITALFLMGLLFGLGPVSDNSAKASNTNKSFASTNLPTLAEK